MKEELLKRLDLLAEKFGTSTEHLWGVLLRQAPLSSTTDLVVLMVLALVSCWALRKAFTMENEDAAGLLGIGGGILGIITLIAFTICASSIVAGFFNPEYWALSEVAGWLKK